ncbi:uncharacterized protein LOC127804211 [Diospyros lotus]|uniref:uncharacterized protein LOC127804211 n=1 Tax=Diospyros lotus TaxID=55363 RepID=UPI002256DBFA|nr:uncharacterized protein LOC127804211 [Diospyros lotus]
MNGAAIPSLAKPFAAAAAQLFPISQRPHLRLAPIKSSTSGGNDGGGAPPPVKPPIAPPATVEIRFRRGARRKLRKKEERDEVAKGPSSKKAEAEGAKDWDSMTVTEKAVELYMGEKGLLFWLNKFAYASIFVIIGAWILFRFVGPALNLYQLDSPPLSPTSVFKGS